MGEARLQTLAILVDNEAGVLSQISRLFSRKGYNIESLAVGATEHQEVSRITVEVITDEEHINLLVNQLSKLIPVHNVRMLTDREGLKRELVMIKVKADAGDKRNELMQIANIFRASIVDVSLGALTIAIIGDEQKITGLVKILSQFEILELVRTGVIALERGQMTIYDDTKEKGEFNYGKNVL
ncbi:MAG: acetolactate synthase small subunit [Lachnospiraceae bacterium]|nr:acetolactate synthase small subunit [Lachnospiraceae bacterium]